MQKCMLGVFKKATEYHANLDACRFMPLPKSAAWSMLHSSSMFGDLNPSLLSTVAEHAWQQQE